MRRARARYQRVLAAAANDPALQEVLRTYQDDIQAGHDAEARGIAGWDAWRDQVAVVREHTVAHLDYYLEQFARQVERHGGQVSFAADAAEACRIVGDVAADAGAGLVVKSKSMVSEEVGLNRALQARGMEVAETDLGEYILQLADERPAHIVGPALHKSLQDVTELFSKEAGRRLNSEPDELAAFARQALREKFLAADVGISGCNFGVASTGAVVLVTSEGNGRMATSLPRTHIVLMGLERLVPDWQSLDSLLTVLPRAGVGGAITTYVSGITGPRRAGDADGPERLHVVVLDNGRADLLGGPYESMLHCIRCGACLDFCPVFRHVGGHSYGPVYSGPMGAVLTPLLLGLEEWADLPYLCSLCGACEEVCSARIPLTRLILSLRRDAVEAGLVPLEWRLGMQAFAAVTERPRAYGAALRGAGRAVDALTRHEIKPPDAILRPWTASRELPLPARRPFGDWWAGRQALGCPGPEGRP